MLVRLQAQPARARRDGRDRLPGIQDLRVGAGRRHHGLLRRDLSPGPDGPCEGSDRGQARARVGEGVPEGGHPHRGWHVQGNRHRHPARWHSLAAAGQRGTVGPGRALRQGIRRTTVHHKGAVDSPPEEGAGQLPADSVRGRLRDPGPERERTPRRCFRKWRRSSRPSACGCRRRRR